MIGGFVAVGFIFMPQYNKWMYNPIIRSIEDNYYPIEKINFPAVTICSNNKVFFGVFSETNYQSSSMRFGLQAWSSPKREYYTRVNTRVGLLICCETF